MSNSDVESALERMFWPEPTRRPGGDRSKGVHPAVQLLLSNSSVQRRWQTVGSRSLPTPTSSGQLLRDELRSHLNRAPQVLVKITGKSRGLAGIREHLRYIAGGRAEKPEERDEEAAPSRDAGRSSDGAGPGERALARPLILETGEEITTQAGLADLQAEWRRGVAPVPWTGDRAEAMHILYQMPAGTDPQRLLEAVQATASVEFDGHRYAMALHLHQSTPHVHLIVRAANDVDGRRLNPRKADLHRWRMRFAHELRARGVDAAASRQRTRGVAQRHEHLWEQKMEQRAAGLRKRALRAQLAGDVRLAGELGAKASAVRTTERTVPRAADTVTERQLRGAQERWNELGQMLATSADPSDRTLAQRTLEFARRAFGIEVESSAVIRPGRSSEGTGRER